MKQYGSQPVKILATEIVQASDPPATGPRMFEAKYSESGDLICRGTFKVILKQEVPEGANVLTAQFVLAIKSTVDGEIKFKVRYVAEAHLDVLKDYLVY